MGFQDMTILAKVKAALVQAEDVSPMDIDVDVKDGGVTLKGDVSQKAHDQAIMAAKSVDGVEAVEDRLNVTSSQ